MKIAIMQPYAFPYLGYFQMAAAADRFVVLDDVPYSKGGWINRNRIIRPGGGGDEMFTIPLQGAGPHKRIDEIEIGGPARWREKLLRRIQQTYQYAPQFHKAWPLVRQLLSDPEPKLAAFLRITLKGLFEYLEIDTPLADPPPRGDLGGAERLIEICQSEGATAYINAEGGRGIYDPAQFAAEGIGLSFVRHRELPYPQFGDDFVARLSVIDAMMFADRDTLRALLAAYTLETH